MAEILRRALLVLAFAVLLGGCGGGDGGDDGRTTGTQGGTTAPRTQTVAPENPEGLDIEAIGFARDRFVSICRARDKSPARRSDTRLTREMGTLVTTLIRGFRGTPDEPFRRSPGVPPVTMREVLLSLALVADRDCGGGDAVARQEARLRRAADAPRADDG